MSDFSLKNLLSGYEHKDDRHGESFFSRSVTGYMNKSRGQHKILRGLTVIGDKLSETLAYTSTRGYGAFLICFGMLSLMLHFIKEYLDKSLTVSPYVFVVGIVASLLSIPFLIFDKPISLALADFPLTDYIFYEFFCIKRTPLKAGAKGLHAAVCLIPGIALAILGSFVPLWTVVLGIGIALYVFLTFTSPEFSYFLIFLIFPYVNLIDTDFPILTVLVAVTLLSYARKVLLGKRIYYFEQYDIILFVLLLFILLAGVFMKGMESFTASVELIVLAMGYVLTNGLCTNRRLCDCVVNAVVISSVPVSFFSALSFVIEVLKKGTLSVSVNSVFFSNSQVLALFLVVSAVFAFYLAVTHRMRSGRVIYSTLLVVIFLGIVSTLQVWAFITLLLAFLCYGATALKRGTGLAMAVCVLLPSVFLFLPVSVMQRLAELPVLSALKLDRYAVRWANSFSILKEHLFTGIGMGEDSFRTEYSEFGGVLFNDSGSFFLEVGVESGVFTLFCLFVFLAVRLVHRSKYSYYVSKSAVHATSPFASVALATMLIFGTFNYIWGDPSTYYLFWCIMGMGSATLRISKLEFDDRFDYYHDGSSSDSYSVDVHIKG